MADIFKPILFSTPMVQAILQGTKTQTRRIIKPQPEITEKGWQWSGQRPKARYNSGSIFCSGINVSPTDEWGLRLHSKFQIGNILWVRETYRKFTLLDDGGNMDFNKEIAEYRADSPDEIRLCDGDGFQEYNKDGTEKMIPWKPSIFMPKAVARIFLNVTNVRVERLQDISEADAATEGVLQDVTYQKDFKSKMIYRDYTKQKFGCLDAKSSFMTLWQKINGENSWSENPFVWVYEFEVIEKPKDFDHAKL